MDPEKMKGFVAVATTMIGLPTMIIILRCVAVRVVRKSKFGWDDYLAIADLPFIVAIAAITLAMVNIGEHLGDSAGQQAGPPGVNGTTNGTPNNFTGGFLPSNATDGLSSGIPNNSAFAIPTQMVNMISAIQFLYVVGLTLPRLSIIFFYHRIFGKIHRWFITALRVEGGICVAWMIVNIIVLATKCSSIRDQFAITPSKSSGHCINAVAYGISLLATSIFIDTTLLVLPMPLIFKIKAPLSKRFSVAFMMAIGCSVIVLTTGRLILTVQAGPFVLRSGLLKRGPIGSFIQLEAAMSLVSVSLPTILTLFRHLLSKGKQSFKTSASSAEPLRSNKSGYQNMSDYHRSIKTAHNGSTSVGTGNNGFKTPIVRTTTAESEMPSSSPSQSGHREEYDAMDGDALHPMPHQILVKYEYHVSKPGYI